MIFPLLSHFHVTRQQETPVSVVLFCLRGRTGANIILVDKYRTAKRCLSYHFVAAGSLLSGLTQSSKFGSAAPGWLPLIWSLAAMPCLGGRRVLVGLFQQGLPSQRLPGHDGVDISAQCTTLLLSC